MTIDELKEGANHFNNFRKSLKQSLIDFDEIAEELLVHARKNNENPTKEDSRKLCVIVAKLNNNLQLAKGFYTLLSYLGDSLTMRIESVDRVTKELENQGVDFGHEVYNPDKP